MVGSHHRSVLWKKELNCNNIIIIRTERPDNTKFLPSRTPYFRSHFASSSQCWHFCTGQALQSSSAHNLSGENLHYKHRFWWNSMIQKCIKTTACRKAGYSQQWSPALFANTLLQRCFNCIYVDKWQRDFRVLRHFFGSTAAGNPSSVGWSWKPQAEKSSWSLSRPQGFQNIWYPWAGSAHLQHIAFPVPSTPFQKSHNCFYSDLAQFSSLKRHSCVFWTLFEIMILFIVSKLSFNHTSKTAKEINLTELHKLLHSAFIGTQSKGAHAAQDTKPGSESPRTS